MLLALLERSTQKVNVKQLLQLLALIGMGHWTSPIDHQDATCQALWWLTTLIRQGQGVQRGHQSARQQITVWGAVAMMLALLERSTPKVSVKQLLQLLALIGMAFWTMPIDHQDAICRAIW